MNTLHPTQLALFRPCGCCDRIITAPWVENELTEDQHIDGWLSAWLPAKQAAVCMNTYPSCAECATLIPMNPVKAESPHRVLVSIPLLKQAHPEFPGLIAHIQSLGTDSLAYFGGGYTHEGGYAFQQNPEELAALATFLKDLRPQGWQDAVYLEIGSASGGVGRFLWELFRFKRFLSIDDGKHPRAPEKRENFQHIQGGRVLVHDSHEAGSKRWLEGHVSADGPLDVAFVDGDHSYEGITQDLQLVVSFCRPGAVVILHDIVACEGVNRAWLKAVQSGLLIPLAEFVGAEGPLGIGVGVIPT